MSIRLPSGRRTAVQLGLAAGLGIVGLLVAPSLGLAGPAFALGLVLGTLLGTLPAMARPGAAAAAAPAAPSGERKTVYVGNLAFKASREELEGLFAPYGTVHSARIMTDRATRKPRGFAFVEMDAKGADAAIRKLNGTEFLGRTLKVNVGKERPDKGRND